MNLVSFFQKLVLLIYRIIGVSDKKYMETQFFFAFGYAIDWENPQGLNEKTHWMKLYYRKPYMTKLADKYAVREFVKEKIGTDYLVPLFGVYENVEELKEALPSLPNRFILKATHGCGWNIIVSNKEQIAEEDFKKLTLWLSKNFFERGREWAYKDIPPKIICEELIEPINLEYGLVDYKFYCFAGEPYHIQVDVGRYGQHRRGIYNLEWKKLAIKHGSLYTSEPIPKPRYLNEMIEVARKLSEGMPFCRVDLYAEQKVLFGEMTFYPASGLRKYQQESFNQKLGDLIPLP